MYIYEKRNFELDVLGEKNPKEQSNFQTYQI